MARTPRSTVRKVFLSSTAKDLQKYRDAVCKAISGLDGYQCIRMEDFGARDEKADPFCRARVAECEVFVGLVGYLYGSSPEGSVVSFTQGEYDAAVESEIPRLLFLTPEEFPMTLRESDALWQRQQAFRDRVKKDRIVAFFENPDSLATKVVAALPNLKSKKPPTASRARKRTTRSTSPDLAQARDLYLRNLVERYRYLDFKGMGATDRLPLRLPLLEMYVPLKARVETPEGETWERLRLAGRRLSEEEADAIGKHVSEPRPILELLGKNAGLIILGDPGAGKTTFLKYLALLLATGQGETLGLKARLPVLLPLSAYANVLAEKDVRLDQFIARYAEERGVGVLLGPLLEQAFRQGEVLLLLDGLDEVRDPSLRNTVVERVIRDCYSAHRGAGNRVVLTSRIVGYREIRPQAEGLAECTLVDFEDEEIKSFVEKWTSAVEQAASEGTTLLATQEAERECEELLEATQRNPGVRSLAANPLLLTILALMKRQGVTLPERRVELYQTYIETLLRSWNLVRSLAGRSSRDLDLVETLKVLAPLALWMHRTSPGVGLVKEWDLHRELERIFREERGSDDPEKATRRFLEDVREHAALLLDRGGRQYGFIHLTFQEYLAGVALAQLGQQDIRPVVAQLAEHVGEAAWHEVSLLTIGYLGIVQKRDEAASAVVEALIKKEPGSPGEAIIFAGRAITDAGSAGVTLACRQAVVTALLTTIRSETIPARRRVAAGEVLAALGDPRPGVTTVEGMEFCRVPAGTFLMGSAADGTWDDEKPLHEVDLPYEFSISKYPLTVGQFRQYLEESQLEPEDSETLRGPLNTPAAWVSWQEALKLCAWLTKKWLKAGAIEPGWRVSLPSEAEWEKAAKGDDARIYPWGDAADPNRAHFYTEGSIVGDPSTVGCFPLGASLCGCEEMSGNVWEWTRSLYGDYPYPEQGQSREFREDLSTCGSRVLRGGSYSNDPESVRCATRLWSDPSTRDWDFGFRVVLLPPSPGEPPPLKSPPAPPDTPQTPR